MFSFSNFILFFLFFFFGGGGGMFMLTGQDLDKYSAATKFGFLRVARMAELREDEIL